MQFLVLGLHFFRFYIFRGDVEDSVKDSFLEEVNKKKKEKAFHVLTLTIGSSTILWNNFSIIVRVNDFEDEERYTAFAI
jgi:hypothetical protein